MNKIETVLLKGTQKESGFKFFFKEVVKKKVSTYCCIKHFSQGKHLIQNTSQCPHVTLLVVSANGCTIC